jgi:hypothetical protein
MTSTHGSKSAAIRAHVNYPILNSDGHQLEIRPLFYDYLRAEAGSVEDTVRQLLSVQSGER